MAFNVYRSSGALEAMKARQEREKELAAQKVAGEKAAQEQEGADIGGILGMIGGGIAAAAAIIATGGAAAPVIIPAVAGGAALGEKVGSAAGRQVGKGIGKEAGALIGGSILGPIGAIAGYNMGSDQEAVAQTTEEPNKGQQELSAMTDAMKRRTMPTLSEQTNRLAQSVQVLGRMPKNIQDEYGQTVLKGLTSSYLQDVARSRRRV